MVTPAVLLVLVVSSLQSKPTEDDYYRMVTFPVPNNVVLEVGGPRLWRPFPYPPR